MYIGLPFQVQNIIRTLVIHLDQSSAHALEEKMGFCTAVPKHLHPHNMQRLLDQCANHIFSSSARALDYLT